MAEERSYEAKRDVEELILNLKLRAGTEKELARKMTSGRHRGRGRAIEKTIEGGSIRGHCPGAMSAADGQRDSDTSSLALIIPHVVGTTVYHGVARRGMGVGTEQSSGINRAKS